MSCSPDGDAVWHYTWTHDRTEATTGYFRCEPDFYTEPVQGLAMLVRRPLDSFLHRKILAELTGMPAAERQKLLYACLESDAASPIFKNENPSSDFFSVLAALLLEAASITGELFLWASGIKERLYALAAAPAKLTPLINLALAGETDLQKALAESRLAAAGAMRIDAANAISCACPPWLKQEMQTARADFKKDAGLLAVLHKSFAGPEARGEGVCAKETATRAQQLLEKANLLIGPEMRHEASLSPIALLRQWRLDSATDNGRHRLTLKGQATAYGRGLSLAAARASCLMEIVERACAYASVRSGGDYGAGQVADRQKNLSLIRASCRELLAQGRPFWTPCHEKIMPLLADYPLHWLEADSCPDGKILVPAQSVFLFLNLDEADLFQSGGSTGLAAGNSRAEARLAALLEVLERDADTIRPVKINECFMVKSRDERLQALLDDYRACGIYVYFQDISTEAGLPVYRSLVCDRAGSLATATAAHPDGKRALVSALTETPWPYSWSGNPQTIRQSVRLPNAGMIRYIEDLPDYSLPDPELSLGLLEKMLLAQNRKPIYMDISRTDLEFPVARAFIPQLETCRDFDLSNLPGPRFYAFHAKGYN